MFLVNNVKIYTLNDFHEIEEKKNKSMRRRRKILNPLCVCYNEKELILDRKICIANNRVL